MCRVPFRHERAVTKPGLRPRQAGDAGELSRYRHARAGQKAAGNLAHARRPD